MSGITNPAEEYFKDGGWGWDSTAGVWVKLKVTTGTGHQLVDQGSDFEVVQTTPADLVVGTHGWDGAAWRKLPLVWGYSDVIRETVGTTTAAADTNHLDGSEVPAGEVWVITSISAVNQTTAITRIVARTYEAPDYYDITSLESPAIFEYLNWSGFIPVGAGDRVRVSFYDCVLNDDIYMTVRGYKMKIAE